MIVLDLRDMVQPSLVKMAVHPASVKSDTDRIDCCS
jgi:hypothetical protein